MKGMSGILIVLGFVLIVTAFHCFSAEPNTPSDTIDPAESLLAAVRASDLVQTEDLINNRANVNTKDENGQTPLHVEVSSGNVVIAELIIAKADGQQARRRRLCLFTGNI